MSVGGGEMMIMMKLKLKDRQGLLKRGNKFKKCPKLKIHSSSKGHR